MYLNILKPNAAHAVHTDPCSVLFNTTTRLHSYMFATEYDSSWEILFLIVDINT